MIGGKRSKGKQREKILDGLTKWLRVGRVAETLKATSDRDAWKVMVTYDVGVPIGYVGVLF